MLPKIKVNGAVSHGSDVAREGPNSLPNAPRERMIKWLPKESRRGWHLFICSKSLQCSKYSRKFVSCFMRVRFIISLFISLLPALRFIAFCVVTFTKHYKYKYTHLPKLEVLKGHFLKFLNLLIICFFYFLLFYLC